MKKAIALLMALTMAAATLAGCGGATSSSSAAAADSGSASTPASTSASAAGDVEEVNNGEPVTLTFWANDGSAQWMEVWGGAAEDYMALHPNVTIEVVGIPWDSAVTKFNTAAATGTLPDLAHLATGPLSSMLAMDQVVDLQPYLDEYEGKDSLSPAHLEFYQNFLPNKEGLWGAPMFGSDQQMWYRTDWFEEAGIESFPDNWDDWFDAVATLTTDDHYGYSFRGGNGGWNLLLAFLLNYTDSSEFYDENGQSFFHKENALEGLERWINIYLDGQAPESALNNGYTEMIAEFSNENAAIAWHHLQSESLITEYISTDNLGYGWIPKNSEGRRIKLDEPQAVVMFNSCPEEKREVAWDFIEFLWTPEQQYKIMKSAGGVPTNLDTDVSDMPYVEAAIEQAADPATTVVVAPNYLPDWSAFTNEYLTPDLQALLLGDMEPAEALERWATEADRMYADYMADA